MKKIIIALNLAAMSFGGGCKLQPDYSELKNDLQEMSTAYIKSRALHTAAQLNIAQELSEGPQSVETLSEKLKLDSEALYRLMRMLAEYGVFAEKSGRVFELAPKGTLLTKEHPESVLANIQREDEARWNGFGRLSYSIKTGKPAFDLVNGRSIYEHIKSDLELARNFNLAMAQISETESKAILEKFDFSGFNTVVDIGGGNGAFLGALLGKYKSLTGTVFDLAETFEGELDAKLLKAQARFTTVSGTFFDEIPLQAELFFVKRTLHNWSDEDALRILTNIRLAMRKNDVLLLAEALAIPGLSKMVFDFDVLSLTIGGKIRSRQEFEVLLNRAGFRVKGVGPVDGKLSLIEAVIKSN